MLATGLGAIVNFVLNFILIPKMSHDGASIATLIAEIVVTASMAYLGRKYLPLNLFSLHYADCIIGSILMGIACNIIYQYIDNDFFSLVVVGTIGVLVYCSWLLIRKNQQTIFLLNFVRNKLFKQ